MRRQVSFLFAAALVVLVRAAAHAASIPAHDPHSLIVKFAANVDGKVLASSLRGVVSPVPVALAAIARVGVDSLRPLFPIPPSGLVHQEAYDSLGLGQHFVLTLDTGSSPIEVAEALKSERSIAVVELNYLAKALESGVVPNDPLYGQQWHYGAVDLPTAWGITTGSGSVTVAVLDDGFQYDHPDLAGAFKINSVESNGFPGLDDDLNGLVDDIIGWDFGDDDNNPYPGFSDTHGTHVAGTIGALTNNSTGVAGVDWGCLMLPVRVFNSITGSALTTDVADGIYYSTIMGANVINMSLGSYAFNQLEDDWLHFAYNSGVLVVAAAGNDDSAQVMYPASSAWAMAVGATDVHDWRWYWGPSSGSNYGSQIDICAPGDSIWSTNVTWHSDGPYGVKTGTSMATPHVTGVAALLLSVRPTLSPDSLYWYIAVGAQDLVGFPTEDTPGWDQYHGWGRINAYNSLRLALGQCVCECAHNPQCDPSGTTNSQDVVQTVNAAFRGSPLVFEPGCPHERTDVDASGATNSVDVVKMINVAFRGQSSVANFVDPCN